MSHNQPGPYGGGHPQQPQQPGPYGGGAPASPYGQPPQGAPQPGYGYPQQAPPAQGYGYPQQGAPTQQMPPYGQPQQPPYGQQAPYGQVPPPPAPPKKKTGLIIGVAVAVVAIAGAGWFFTAGGGSSSVADDGKKYKLEMPETVLAGEYTKDGDSTGGDGPVDTTDEAKFKKFGVKDMKNVGAEYKAGEGEMAKVLSVNGAHGEIADPEAFLDAVFADMKTESEKGKAGDTGGMMKLVGSPKDVEPDGLENAAMKCQEIEFDMGALGSDAPTGTPTAFTFPLCVWADHSTFAAVTAADPASIATGKSTSIDAAASMAAKIHGDPKVRVEIK